MEENYIQIGKKKIVDDFLDCKTRKTLKKQQRDFRYEAAYDYDEYEEEPVTRYKNTKKYEAPTKTESPKKIETSKKVETRTYSPENAEIRGSKWRPPETKDYFQTETGETPVESLNYGEKRLGLGEQYNDVMTNIQEIVESALANDSMAEDEIENIINLCEETVCKSIMGDEEEDSGEKIFDYPEAAEHYDAIEVDELTKSVQKYMLDLIKNGNQSNIPDPKTGDFPSLGVSNPTTSTAKYAKALDSLTKSKASIKYKNSDNAGQWEIQKHPFFEGQKSGSSQEIFNLMKLFPSLDLTIIRYSYSLFEENYDDTLDFLKRKYSKYYQSSPLKIKKKTTVVKPQVSQPKKYYASTELYTTPEVERILREMSFEEIREEYHRHRQIKAILDRTAAQARAGRSGGLSGLTSISQGETNKIRLLEMASKKYILSKYRANNCLFGIDLHGLYWDEARDIINEQIDFIMLNVLGNKSQYRYNKKIIDGEEHLCYEIITGKGNHSQGGFSVLYRNLCKMFEAENYRYKEGDGKIYLFLAV